MDKNQFREAEASVGEGQSNAKNRSGSTVLKLLGVMGIVGLLICLFLPAVRSARPAAERNACANNMKQIALALLNYEKDHHALPPAYTTDAAGKPLHSWRTLILPYLEQEKLFQSIDFSKPWNDPANAEAFKTVVPAYQCPASPWDGDRTTYLAVVTSNSCFRQNEPRQLSEIPKQAQTVMVIEADLDHAVPWMSPTDADEKSLMDDLHSQKHAHPGGANVAFVDCHVEFISTETPEAKLRALISTNADDKAALRGND